MEDSLETKHALHIDSRPNQSSQHQNPIESHRRTTDRLCIFVFSVILIVWVVFCILGLNAPQIRDGSDMQKIMKFYQWCLNAPVLRFSVGFILTFLISTAVVCLCTFLTDKFTKFFISIGLGLFLLSTIIYFYKAIFATISTIERIGRDPLLFLSIISMTYTWFGGIYMVASSLNFLKADKDVLCDLTKDSCRAILRSPSIILFMCLITLLMALVASFSLNALIFDIFAFQSIFYIVVTLLGGLCALGFLPYLAIAVVSEYTINYYWNKDRTASSGVGRSVVNALRYHIGTIMFASTIIVSSLCAIVQAFKHKRSPNNRENYIFYFASKVYLALRMPEIALIFTSIYGTGFVKSSQMTFDVVLRRPSLFLATLAACEAIVYIPALLVAIASIVVFVTEADVNDPNSVEGLKNIFLVAHGMFYPLICFTLLLWCTMKALLINKIIMLVKEDQDTEGKVQIIKHT